MTDIAKQILDMGHTPVSYSALKEFRKGGIHRYYRYKERELDEVSTPSTDLGSLIDLYLLDKEKFESDYLLDTTSAPGSDNQLNFASLIALEGLSREEAYKRSYKNPPKTESKLKEKANDLYEDLKEYIEFLPNTQGKLTYNNDVSFGLNQIRMNIMGHKFLSTLFDWINGNCPDHIEVLTHVPLQADFMGIPMRGELDIVIMDHRNKTLIVYDLKSTNYHLTNFGWQVKSLDYVLQAAIYGILAKQAMLSEGYSFQFPRLIAVRTTGGYDAGVFDIPPAWLRQEINKLKSDLEEIKWHYETKQFKYPRAYYEGDGVLELEYIKDMDLWKQEIEQSVS